MIASHVTLPTLVQAAQTIGVRIEHSSLSTMRHRVKLLPETPHTLYKPACKRCRERVERTNYSGTFYPCRCRRIKGEQGDAKYQRISPSHNGRVNAVCWHGFRDYFRTVYQTTPKARFSTSLDTWRHAEDFERRFRESGHKNIGSQMCPMAMAEACRCPESGSVGLYEYSGRLNESLLERGESLPDPVSMVTNDMGVDDVLVKPEGVTVERWSDYNAKMNALLMGRTK